MFFILVKSVGLLQVTHDGNIFLYRLVEILVEKGTDVNQKNGSGKDRYIMHIFFIREILGNGVVS